LELIGLVVIDVLEEVVSEIQPREVRGCYQYFVIGDLKNEDHGRVCKLIDLITFVLPPLSRLSNHLCKFLKKYLYFSNMLCSTIKSLSAQIKGYLSYVSLHI
jgi:hypothetical protein